MAIKYKQAPEIKKIAEDIIYTLNWKHIHIDSIAFLRSTGSTAHRTIARCHALGKAMQLGMNRSKSFYLIEAISEQYDKLDEKEQVKVIIHELMHIPKTFGGGFIHHDKVHDRTVNQAYKQYLEIKNKKTKWF